MSYSLVSAVFVVCYLVCFLPGNLVLMVVDSYEDWPDARKFYFLCAHFFSLTHLF
jgi:hypothetical protein